MHNTNIILVDNYNITSIVATVLILIRPFKEFSTFNVHMQAVFLTLCNYLEHVYKDRSLLELKHILSINI